MNLTLVLLLAYAAGLIGLGVWIGRRVESSGGFFVANRRLGPVLLFSTVLAANIGGTSTVGAAGLGYLDGPLQVHCQFTHWPVALPSSKES